MSGIQQEGQGLEAEEVVSLWHISLKCVGPVHRTKVLQSIPSGHNSGTWETDLTYACCSDNRRNLVKNHKNLKAFCYNGGRVVEHSFQTHS
jgi:hypothetical protein